jgi:uncharacterized protein (TIGR02611 family)
MAQLTPTMRMSFSLHHSAAPEAGSLEPLALPELKHEEQHAAGILARLGHRFDGLRSRVRRRPGGVGIWRAGIALLGLAVVIVGVVLLVLPGPGWLMIFIGFGIWATEFKWAESLLKGVRRRVTAWTAWIRRQPRRRVILAGALAMIVVAAIGVGVWQLAK